MSETVLHKVVLVPRCLHCDVLAEVLAKVYALCCACGAETCTVAPLAALSSFAIMYAEKYL